MKPQAPEQADDLQDVRPQPRDEHAPRVSRSAQLLSSRVQRKEMKKELFFRIVKCCTLVMSPLAILGLCIVLVWLADRCSSIAHAQIGTSLRADKTAVDPTRTGYVGDEACTPCHKQQSISYRETAHHLTSQPPDKTSILGSFKDGENILMIANPATTDVHARLFFKMDFKEGGYYQTAVAEAGEMKLTRSGRIDVVIGSGVRGQSYLYWSGDTLYELPVSYWSEGKQWINSPGYEDRTANFKRPVDPRCLECHASYIHPLSTDPHTNVYDKDSLVTGISCESCHGPGADHIAIEGASSSKQRKRASDSILNPVKFIRDRQMDQCALCHNGAQRHELTPAFTYLPDQPLDQYLAASPIDPADQPDVHGNQVGLLTKSRCYLASSSMSCYTCHDVHGPERAAAAYSDRCLRCHKWKSCGVSHTMGGSITHNCIDCHMPLQQSGSVVPLTAGKFLPTSIRSHWIKVYPGTDPASAPQSALR